MKKTRAITMILGRVIKDFPYPEKLCPYCNTTLKVVNAIHYEQDKYHFKALYLDPNPNCPVYDEGAKRAYARIYYSSEEAFWYYQNVKIPVQRWSQSELYTIYQ
jgi:hypothetical protein